MKHIKNFSLNENNRMTDSFEGVRTKIQELAEYFQMDDKLFMEIIWNGANEINVSEKSRELIDSMSYSFGLI